MRLAPLLRCGATYEMESRSLALFRLAEAADNTKVKRIPARSRAAFGTVHFSPMHIPTATYRLQFHKDFRFENALEIVGYLRDLGITDVYASPIFRARAGSMNRYDVVDHSEIDNALGGAKAFDKLSAALRAHGMGLILDVVPNHMGIGEPSNGWWMDVLENGQGSSYAAYFDIEWQPANPHLENKVLLPILEDQYGNVLEDGKLNLVYEDGAFFIHYYEAKLPLTPRTYSAILTPQSERLAETLGRDAAQLLELQSILTAIGHLPLRTEADPERLASAGVRRRSSNDASRRCAKKAPRREMRSRRRCDSLTAMSAIRGASICSTNCWTRNPTAWRSGVSPAKRSITGDFSTSMSWRQSAPKPPRFSKRRTDSFFNF